MASRHAVDLLDRAKGPFEAQCEEPWISAEGAYRNLAERPPRTAHVSLEARDTQHDRPSAERLGQDYIVARQAGEPLDQVLAHSWDEFRQAAR